MIEITVQLGEPLRRQAGAKIVIMQLEENGTVADLIHELGLRYPMLAEYLDDEQLPATVFLADQIADLETTLAADDRPILLWPLMGG